MRRFLFSLIGCSLFLAGCIIVVDREDDSRDVAAQSRDANSASYTNGRYSLRFESLISNQCSSDEGNVRCAVRARGPVDVYIDDVHKGSFFVADNGEMICEFHGDEVTCA